MLPVKNVNPGLTGCFLNKLGCCHQEASAPLLLSGKITLVLSKWTIEQMFKSNVCIRKKISSNYLINFISSIINELPLILVDIKLSSTFKYPQNKLG